jgi:hypothetical protein
MGGGPRTRSSPRHAASPLAGLGGGERDQLFKLADRGCRRRAGSGKRLPDLRQVVSRDREPVLPVVGLPGDDDPVPAEGVRADGQPDRAVQGNPLAVRGSGRRDRYTCAGTLNAASRPAANARRPSAPAVLAPVRQTTARSSPSAGWGSRTRRPRRRRGGSPGRTRPRAPRPWAAGCRVADVERLQEQSPGGLGQVELGSPRRDGPHPGQFLLERDIAGHRGALRSTGSHWPDCSPWARAVLNGSALIRSRNAWPWRASQSRSHGWGSRAASAPSALTVSISGEVTNRLAASTSAVTSHTDARGSRTPAISRDSRNGRDCVHDKGPGRG